MKIYDITLVLRPEMPVWPGERQLEIKRIMEIQDGKGANVSEIRTGCHIGTHVDAPLHFIEGGDSIDKVSLDLFVGRASVYDMGLNESISRRDLEPLDIRSGQRVIFKTPNSDLWEYDSFQTEFVYITEDAARYLVDSGVKTVGIDYLSVEKYGLDDAPAHHILLAAGLGVIEGLDLREVSEGEYELFCLPLKLAGSDGAPARAILKEIE
jgi:arylformamidase